MRFGYVPALHENLLCEIEFAKENFDFVEVTYVPGADFARIGRRAIEKVLGNFPAKGCVHWSYDFSNISRTQMQKAISQLSFFSSIGIKDVTVTPSLNKNLFVGSMLSHNMPSFLRVRDFCWNNNISLYVENTVAFPFNKPAAINSLLYHFPTMKFTLNLGHSLAGYADSYPYFLKDVSKSPSHFCLHDADFHHSHLAFTEKEKMLEVMQYVKSRNSRASVGLQIFYKVQDGKKVSLETKERRQILLDHLKILHEEL